MAKSKPAKPAAPKATKAEKPKAASTEVARSAKTEAVPTRAPGAFSDVEIGYVAGNVWAALAKGEELTVAAIKKAVPAPGDVVMAAIGWLAREHKLVFTEQGRSVKISLR